MNLPALAIPGFVASALLIAGLGCGGGRAAGARGGTAADAPHGGGAGATAGGSDGVPPAASVGGNGRGDGGLGARAGEGLPSGEAADRAGPCGPLGCRLVPSPEDAFREVLIRNPLVLAIGEGHAQKGSEGVASATRRFTESFLPLLKDRASDIVIELWLPDPQCNKQVDEVRQQQKPVTDSQAKTNKSEFTILAEEANKLGIVPWPLRPTCEEYQSIASAGDEAIPMMLELTAKMAQRTIERCLERNAAKGVNQMVVSYGGAMHNDLTPAPGREAWTFGPALAKRAPGRYVELDLFVPESILDTPSWRQLAWHPYFDRSQRHTMATFYHPSQDSWVLVFPHTGR